MEKSSSDSDSSGFLVILKSMGPIFFSLFFPLYFYIMVRLFPSFHPTCLYNFCLETKKKVFLVFNKYEF
ncbi:unnamed protein product [Meloidogyne enterolobii]|uniref:Uncharacterized protein n=1 Tax=Meloidogyne enterolobii TaxID=390850 RepID=A0ACB1AIZ7_MELEN